MYACFGSVMNSENPLIKWVKPRGVFEELELAKGQENAAYSQIAAYA